MGPRGMVWMSAVDGKAGEGSERALAGKVSFEGAERTMRCEDRMPLWGQPGSGQICPQGSDQLRSADRPSGTLGGDSVSPGSQWGTDP